MNRINLLALAAIACTVAPAFAKIPIDVNAPSSAKLGASVKVCVKTEAKAKCKIEAQDAGFTQSMKLMDQTADKAGKATWKFEIPKNFKADKMPIIITVDKNGIEDKSIRSISIVK